MNASRLYSGHGQSADKRIGNYRVIRLLGRGGFAAVYLCEHRYLRTLAAVKVLRAGMNEVEKANFYAEARIAASLVHQRIIRVLEFGVENGRAYLVMDYAPHGTLRQLCPPGKCLVARAVVKYIEQAADALQYVHNRGLVHRDIKPENLLLGVDNQLLLSDFGISINAYRTNSRDAGIVGTVPYMAPELSEGEACFASDQYALGVVAYEWLCGTRPFLGRSKEIIDQHIYDFPPRLREYVPSIPVEVEEVVLRALAKNPRDRFESVQDFAAALKAAFGYRTGTGKAQTRPPTSRPVAGKAMTGKKHEQEEDMWKDAAILFAGDLFTGCVTGMILNALGIAPQFLWVLLSFSLALFAPGCALAMRSPRLFLLVCGLTMMAALPGTFFRSFALFDALYGILLLFGLMVALATIIHFSEHHANQ